MRFRISIRRKKLTDQDNDEKDFSENSVYDRFQDSTYNKSDIDFLMEDDDLRDDFF